MKLKLMFSLILFCCVAVAACGSKEPSPSNQDTIQSALVSNPVPQLDENRQNLNSDIGQSRQNAITRAVSETSPAVVGINVTQIQHYRTRSIFENDPFFDLFFTPRRDYSQKVKSLGSGFLISPDGHIVTNEHVIHEAIEIVVTTTDGQQYNAQVVGQDFNSDIALLKIDGEGFPYIPLGNSDDIIIGEWVIALGNPFGLFDISSKPTVTVGVISATDMDFMGDVTQRWYKNMIQTDAAINGGNSGGPLVNSLGQCIGINTFIFSGNSGQKTSIGIGFAIPVNNVKKILPELKNVGYVDRSFQTGLEVENITPLVARMLSISTRDGVLVSRVTKKSPASKAGLKLGDVIVTINNYRVHSTQDVRQVINSVDVTETPVITLKIFRDGKLIDKELLLERKS